MKGSVSFEAFCLRQERMHVLTDFIGGSLDADLCLDDLASLVEVSPSQLLRFYRAHSGETPIHTLWRLRLLRAREQILSGRFASLTDAALAAGYNSLAAFSRAYSRQFGHSPQATLSRACPSETVLRLVELPAMPCWTFHYAGNYADNGYYKKRLVWLRMAAGGSDNDLCWRENDLDHPFSEKPGQRVELKHFSPAGRDTADVPEAYLSTSGGRLYAVMETHPDSRARALHWIREQMAVRFDCQVIDAPLLERDLNVRIYRPPQERRLALYVPVAPRRRDSSWAERFITFSRCGFRSNQSGPFL